MVFLNSNNSENKIHKNKIILTFCFICILSLNEFKIKIKTLFINKKHTNEKNNTNKNKSDYLKVGLCTICKEENLYIKEFIDTYKTLGFDHIFIYDNNDINGENLEEAIIKYIDEGLITIINFRGYRGPKRGPQMDAYYDCYNKNNLDYDWIAFFDVDEYLTINDKKSNIKDFLINSRYNDCEIIKINWKHYTDNNKLDYENKLLKERFNEEANNDLYVNTVYKVIVRGNISNYSLRKNYNAHDIFKSNHSCDSNGIKRLEDHIIPPEYKYAKLNHYKKTIKEFCKKIKKGDVYFNTNLNEKFLKYRFRDFFSCNKKTKEKIDIFNKEFNTTFK